MSQKSPVPQVPARFNQMEERHRRTWLLAIFLLALVARLYPALVLPANPTADAADYHALASNLVAGQGYSNETGRLTSWHPPGYSAFLAGIYTVFGLNIQAAYVIQAILGSISVMLLVALGWLLLGRQAGLVAGLLAAVYPSFVWPTRLLMSENLALPLLLAALCSTALLLRTRHVAWAVLLGVLLGLGALVRGAHLFFALGLLLGITVVLSRQRLAEQEVPKRSLWQQKLALPLAVMVSMGIVLLPWTLRNYHVFGRLVPVATNDGITLYACYWPPMRGGKRIWGSLPQHEDPVVARADALGNEALTSSYLRSVTLQRLRERPLYFFQLWPSKLLMLAAPFDWELFPHAASKSRSVNFGYILGLIPALLGIWLMRRQRGQSTDHPLEDRWLLWVAPAAVLVQTLIFYGSPRLRQPAESSLVLFAALGILWLWGIVRQKVGKGLPESSRGIIGQNS